MRVGARIAAVVAVGLVAASPVGFAVGSQQGGGQSDPDVDSSKMYVPREGIYAHIPEERPPEGHLDLCRERLIENPKDECGIFVEIEEARDKGLLQPGDYTQEEFEAILAAARS